MNLKDTVPGIGLNIWLLANGARNKYQLGAKGPRSDVKV